MEQIREQMKMITDILGDPELTLSIAQMFKSLVKDLEIAGFSREEALLLASSYSSKK